MSDWRVAESLDALLDEVNARAPQRGTASDGSIGDAAHSARESDHNPNDDDVVTARDFTHDPGDGADMNLLAEHLRKSRDPRIKYVIWNGRMFSSYPTSSTPAWTWRDGTGHTQHLHLSVQGSPSLYDSTKPWGWAKGSAVNGSWVSRGDTGPDVGWWQRRLNRVLPNDSKLELDSEYGAAMKDAVVRVARLKKGGDRINPLIADRIEQAIVVATLRRVRGVNAQDLANLVEEVIEDIEVVVTAPKATVRRKTG